MNRPAFFRRASIFTKLVTMFLLVIVPLYIAALTVNELGSSNVRTEISESLAAQTHFYLRSLEVELDRIMKQQREYINDNDLSLLSIAPDTMSPYDKTNAVQGLQQRLLMMKSTSPYIEKISVHIPMLRQSISTDDMFGGIPADEFAALKAAAYSGNDISLTVWRDRFFLCLTYPNLYLTPDASPLYMLSVELSRPELQSMLSLLAENGAGGAVWADADSLWHMHSGGRRDLLPEIVSAAAAVPPQTQGEVATIRAGAERMLFVRQTSELLNTALLVYVPERVVLGPLQKYRQWFWVLSLVSAVVVAVFSFWIYRAIHRPIVELVRAFRRTEQGDFHVHLRYRSNDEFFYLYGQFNKMVRRLGVLIQEVLEQKTRAQRSELKQLQAQIHPHFLYNSFFILSGLAKLEDYERVVYASDKLGEYFRYITRSGADEVSLAQELHHTQAYVDIQQLRFANRIAVMIDALPERCRELAVPRLVIQPLVENAYNHGLENKTAAGRIHIALHGEPNRLLVTVEDNGIGLSPEELARMNRELAEADNASEYTGLINVHRRIQLKFGPGSGLQLERGAHGGLKVTMSIEL